MSWNKKGGGLDDFFDILFTLIGGFFIFFFLFGIIDNLTDEKESITLALLEQVKTKEALLSVLNEPYKSSILAEVIYQEQTYAPDFQESLGNKFNAYFGKVPTDVFIDNNGDAIYYDLKMDPHWGAADEVVFVDVILLNEKRAHVRLK